MVFYDEVCASFIRKNQLTGIPYSLGGPSRGLTHIYFTWNNNCILWSVVILQRGCIILCSRPRPNCAFLYLFGLILFTTLKTFRITMDRFGSYWAVRKKPWVAKFTIRCPLYLYPKMWSVTWSQNNETKISGHI